MLKSLIRRKSSASPPDNSAPQSSRASGVIEQRDQQRDHASAGHSSKSTRKADTIVVLDNSYSMRLRLRAAKALLRHVALMAADADRHATTGRTCYVRKSSGLPSRYWRIRPVFSSLRGPSRSTQTPIRGSRFARTTSTAPELERVIIIRGLRASVQESWARMMTMWNARGGSSMLLSSILPAVVDYGHAHSKVGQGCMRLCRVVD